MLIIIYYAQLLQSEATFLTCVLSMNIFILSQESNACRCSEQLLESVAACAQWSAEVRQDSLDNKSAHYSWYLAGKKKVISLLHFLGELFWRCATVQRPFSPCDLTSSALMLCCVWATGFWALETDISPTSWSTWRQEEWSASTLVTHLVQPHRSFKQIQHFN